MQEVTRQEMGIKRVESHLVGGSRISQDFDTCHHASLMNLVCVFYSLVILNIRNETRLYLEFQARFTDLTVYGGEEQVRVVKRMPIFGIQ